VRVRPLETAGIVSHGKRRVKRREDSKNELLEEAKKW
jgi:hypothetical protein